MKIFGLLIIFCSSTAFGSIDILYNKVTPEFVRGAHKRFERFYFDTCKESKLKSESVEARWVQTQSESIKALGGFFTDLKTISAPVYSWRLTENKSVCHSMIVPHLQEDSKDLKGLLGKYKLADIAKDEIAAVEFYFNPESIAVYVNQSGGLKKIRLVNGILEATPLSYTTDFKVIEKQIIRLQDVQSLGKISSFIHAGLDFGKSTELSVFFVINMYAGLFPGAGDILVRDVVKNFYFKPRAIGVNKQKEIIIYYP